MGNTVKLSARRLRRGESRGVALLLLALAGCGPRDAASSGAAGAAAAGDSAGSAVATPVGMATVVRGNLALVVSGPGRTDVLDVQKVRAPFTGTLTSLRVVIGDRVSSGQTIGEVVGQASQAALAGAESMLRAATTPGTRSDAQRALELARRNLVATPLRAPRAGLVTSRGASQGDLVSQGDSIVSIASTGSIVFVAQIAQIDLPRVHPGEPVTVKVPGHSAPLVGIVHGLLPADMNAMSVPVRVDLAPSGPTTPTGIFGTADITVGERTGASVVPVQALLRDDVSGIVRLAVATPAGRAHWLTVTPGIQEGDRVEIASPALAPGQRVIVSGQVGLPEGSLVRETPDSSMTADTFAGGPGPATRAGAAGPKAASGATTTGAPPPPTSPPARPRATPPRTPGVAR